MDARPRTFVAIVPPAEVSAVLARAANEALGSTRGLRLYPAQDLHLTLVFLGAVSAPTRERLGLALDRACAGLRPTVVRATNTGAFPGRARPRVLWTGLERAGEIDALHRAALAAARDAECEPAEVNGARWTPHLTLARARHGGVAVPDAFYELTFDLPWMAIEVVVCQSDSSAGTTLRYPIVHRSALGA